MTAARPVHRASWPHAVIIGGGFGGLYAARGLAHAAVNVTVVDRTNHHLFQPLLYQVATASLSPGDITAPIRWVLRGQKNALVLMAEATRIEPALRRVLLDDGRVLEYDYLVLATGARHSYFRHPEWEPFAPGLKSVEDGAELRRRFLLAFEAAERSDDQARQRALLTFVIVGGGPTGVELAGALPDIARKAMYRDFRRIDTRTTRVILIEAGPRVLPAFPESLSRQAQEDLEALGVEVRVGVPVSEVSDTHVRVGDEFVAACTVFWAAGNAASPLARELGAPLDPAGRLLVEPDLSVPGLPEVFAIGDVARVESRGQVVPAVAPAAMQMGRRAAANIVRSIEGKERQPFRYVNKGNVATIGRHRAVADFGWIRATGRPAWWLWLGIHIMYLIGFRNRISVLVEWVYAYFTYQRGVRLITRAGHAAGSSE